ncbi:hypothetical protein PC9H_008890 [Pleurotus ostreatus]|uniref:Uncharacterized protein n=1 Tax=Pleurotus ostreatus TaxID=5322 RepID=A0A8H6ZU09_PLEOS|nr:uncharacterized protein PC9H_008890 [Pleurotus ostreatus]KAF7426521.1 hypothetical protein PC9H_008890 [Pleurotus ostreatus]KAJ8694078.1 hypothetical protein PTI98_009011 [Pleurotus ostreatus]
MRQYRDILAFLDIEAGVENSDDDDDDDIDTDYFISDAPETPSSNMTTSRHDIDPPELWNTDAESMVNDIIDRYRGSQQSTWKAQHAADRKKYTDGWKTTIAYLPSITDGDIWKVAVTPGSELCVVATIYVEARNYGAALTVLKGINNIWLRYCARSGFRSDFETGHPIHTFYDIAVNWMNMRQ